MASLYIWHYFLVVPAASVEAADAVAPNLNNPDGIEATFLRYPQDDEEDVPTHWIGSFVATQDTPGTPSKVTLEGALVSGDSALGNILWVRSKNEHHPDTTEAEKGKVVATNWNAFSVGDDVSLGAVIDALP